MSDPAIPFSVPDPNAPTPPAKSSSFPWYFAGLLVFLFLCFGGLTLIRHFAPGLVSHLPGGITGTITAAGTPESWTMTPTDCDSGEPRQFLGISFYDLHQPKLGGRLVIPVDDPTHIVLNTPTQGGAVRLDKTECTTWDVDAHRNNSTFNGIWGVTGHARFDCTFDDPVAHFTGDVQFHSCH